MGACPSATMPPFLCGIAHALEARPVASERWSEPPGFPHLNIRTPHLVHSTPLAICNLNRQL